LPPVVITKPAFNEPRILPLLLTATEGKKRSQNNSYSPQDRIACAVQKVDNYVLPMSPKNASKTNITELLHEWNSGNTDVADNLLPLIYDELHRRAAAFMRKERQNHTLQPTALVHEAYLKLIGQRNDNWNDRQHFFAIASQVMRRILVDHARSRHRQKRGGSKEDLPLEEALLVGAEEANVDLIALDEAMAKLAKLDPQQERLVELRYFGGLSLDETAKAIGVSRATAAREWQVAKAWLHREMTRRN
jgi:RNA polymerase sigma factor (TIGR02999 family)